MLFLSLAFTEIKVSSSGDEEKGKEIQNKTKKLEKEKQAEERKKTENIIKKEVGRMGIKEITGC